MTRTKVAIITHILRFLKRNSSFRWLVFKKVFFLYRNVCKIVPNIDNCGAPRLEMQLSISNQTKFVMCRRQLTSQRNFVPNASLIREINWFCWWDDNVNRIWHVNNFQFAFGKHFTFRLSNHKDIRLQQNIPVY